MKVQLILERTSSHQITEHEWIKDDEHKIVEVEIPNTDNSEQLHKGRWVIIGYCDIQNNLEK